MMRGSFVVEQKKQLVPDYIRDLKPYKAGKPIDELAREKGLSKITKLASNENPLGPSPFAIKEMTQALWNIHRYPDSHGYQLKSKLGEYWNLDTKNIILGNGSEGIMAYIARAFIQPGDEVLTSENTFIGFYILAKGVGASLKTVPLTDQFKYDVEKIKDQISDKTKVIYIANPNNPTGTYITKKEFDYLMDYVPDHCIVILDEAYFEFATEFDDYPDSMDYRYDNVITTRTFSKAHGLSGVRVGYGFAHEYFIENLSKVKLPFEPNLIGQAGAIGALDDRPFLRRTLNNNRKRYKETKSFLIERGFEPIESVTNFITFKTPTEDSAQAMFEMLLDEGVIIRPLAANAMPGFVRVSIGTKDEMQHYFEAMDSIMPKWNNKFRG